MLPVSRNPSEPTRSRQGEPAFGSDRALLYRIRLGGSILTAMLASVLTGKRAFFPKTLSCGFGFRAWICDATSVNAPIFFPFLIFTLYSFSPIVPYGRLSGVGIGAIALSLSLPYFPYSFAYLSTLPFDERGTYAPLLYPPRESYFLFRGWMRGYSLSSSFLFSGSDLRLSHRSGCFKLCPLSFCPITSVITSLQKPPLLLLY